MIKAKAAALILVRRSFFWKFLKEGNMRADYHVHTQFSDDSQYPFEQVVRDAINVNIEMYIFDHLRMYKFDYSS